MNGIILKPILLSRQNFKAFGDVIELDAHNDVKKMNYGMTKRFNDMADLDLVDGKGKVLFSIFRTNPIECPFAVKVIERHPLSSQLFYPLSDVPFLVLVAESCEKPKPENLKLFITNGRQGINYKRNTWHHYILACECQSDFIVIDKGAQDNNCEEYFFTDEIYISHV